MEHSFISFHGPGPRESSFPSGLGIGLIGGTVRDWLRHEAPASSRQGTPPGRRWVFVKEEPVGFHLGLGRSFHFPW